MANCTLSPLRNWGTVRASPAREGAHRTRKAPGAVLHVPRDEPARPPPHPRRQRATRNLSSVRKFMRLALPAALLGAASGKAIPDTLYLDYMDKDCCLRLERQGYTGTIPTEFGLLTKFTESFILEENSLTGPIPSELGMLTLLTKHFELSFNRLTGTIPTEVTKRAARTLRPFASLSRAFLSSFISSTVLPLSNPLFHAQ